MTQEQWSLTHNFLLYLRFRVYLHRLKKESGKGVNL
jgi:hypothetical protein